MQEILPAGVDTCLIGCGSKRDYRVHLSLILGLLVCRFVSWIMDKQHACPSISARSIHTLAFVIWSGGQQKGERWWEICNSIKYPSLCLFRAYSQTLQQAFSSTIQLWGSHQAKGSLTLPPFFKQWLYVKVKCYNDSWNIRWKPWCVTVRVHVLWFLPCAYDK